jgi:hypothetical protein
LIRSVRTGQTFDNVTPGLPLQKKYAVHALVTF